jgi:integrase
MLGHSSASMTLNVYAHVVGSMKEEATAEMDRLLA